MSAFCDDEHVDGQVATLRPTLGLGERQPLPGLDHHEHGRRVGRNAADTAFDADSIGLPSSTAGAINRPVSGSSRSSIDATGTACRKSTLATPSSFASGISSSEPARSAVNVDSEAG